MVKILMTYTCVALCCFIGRSKALYSQSPIHPCTHTHSHTQMAAPLPNSSQPITTISNVGFSVFPKDTSTYGWVGWEPNLRSSNQTSTAHHGRPLCSQVNQDPSCPPVIDASMQKWTSCRLLHC